MDTPFAAEHFEVVFAIELGNRVWAFRLGEHGFDFRNDGVVSVNGGRTRMYEFPHAVLGGGFQDVEQSRDVDAGAFDGIRHGFRSGNHRREMKYGIDARHKGIDQSAIGDAAIDEGVIESSEVMEIAGAQVIKNHDFRGKALEVLDEVGADEAGAAGDEESHETLNFKF